MTDTEWAYARAIVAAKRNGKHRGDTTLLKELLRQGRPMSHKDMEALAECLPKQLLSAKQGRTPEPFFSHTEKRRLAFQRYCETKERTEAFRGQKLNKKEKQELIKFIACSLGANEQELQYDVGRRRHLRKSQTLLEEDLARQRRISIRLGIDRS
jgi:hypothetical protein